MSEIRHQLPVFTGNKSSDRKSDIIFGNIAKNYICPKNFRFLGLIWKNKSQPAATLNYNNLCHIIYLTTNVCKKFIAIKIYYSNESKQGWREL